MKSTAFFLVVLLVLAGFESVAVHAVEPVVQDYAGSKAKKAFLQRLLGGDPAAIKTFMKIVLGASLVGGGSYVAYRVLTSGTKPKKPAAASRQLVVPGKPAAGPKPNSRPRRTRRLPVAAPVAPTPTPVLIPVEPEPVVYRAPSPVGSVPDDEPDVVQSRISSPIASLHSEASRREEAPFEFEETDNPDEVTDYRSGRPVLSLEDQLIEAVKRDDIATMSRLKNQHPHVDFSQIKIGSQYQESLLRRAIQYGHLRMVEWLIESAHFDKDAPTDAVVENTPLGVAALYGRTEIVRYLLNRGADRLKRNIGGRTPFGLADNNPDHCHEIRDLLEPSFPMADLPRSPTPESVSVVEEVAAESSVCAGAGCDSEKEEINGSTECSICMDEFGDDAEVTAIKCPSTRHKGGFFWHKFHSKCVNPWLQRHNTCPNCKVTVDSASLIIMPPKNNEGRAVAAPDLPPFDHDLYCARRIVDDPWRVAYRPLASFQSMIKRLGRDGCPPMNPTYSSNQSYSLPYYEIDRGAARFIKIYLGTHPRPTLFQLGRSHSIERSDDQFGWCYALGSGRSLVYFSRPFRDDECINVRRVFGSDDLNSPSFQRILNEALGLGPERVNVAEMIG